MRKKYNISPQSPRDTEIIMMIIIMMTTMMVVMTMMMTLTVITK